LLAEVGLAERPHAVEITFEEKEGRTRVEIAMETSPFLPVDVWGESPIVVQPRRMSTGASGFAF